MKDSDLCPRVLSWSCQGPISVSCSQLAPGQHLLCCPEHSQTLLYKAWQCGCLYRYLYQSCLPVVCLLLYHKRLGANGADRCIDGGSTCWFWPTVWWFWLASYVLMPLMTWLLFGATRWLGMTGTGIIMIWAAAGPHGPQVGCQLPFPCRSVKCLQWL
jgi:hypothetical protein